MLIKNQPTLVVFPLIIQSHIVSLLFPAVSFVLFEHKDAAIARMSVVVVYAVSIGVSFEFRLLLIVNGGDCRRFLAAFLGNVPVETYFQDD